MIRCPALLPSSRLAPALLAVALLAQPALAQSPATQAPATQAPVTQAKTVASGGTVRLDIAPNLKKDCTPGPMPEFKVSAPPKNGSTITKVGKLKTPASYRCPNKEAAVQALFYQPNAGFTGADEVTFEVKASDGQVQTRTVKITVGPASSKPGNDAKKDATDL